MGGVLGRPEACPGAVLGLPGRGAAEAVFQKVSFARFALGRRWLGAAVKLRN